MDVFCVDDDFAEFIAKLCGVDRAGVIAMALVDPEMEPTDLELSDDAYWTATLLVGSPPKAHVIKPTRGEYQGGTPTEEEGFGRSTTIVTGADHAIDVESQGMKENRAFYEYVNRRKWKIAFVTNGDLLYFIDKPTTIYATPSNPRDPKASAFWKINGKWQDYSNPRIVDMPEDIFEVE